MPLTKLQTRPGLVRDTTSYANEGGWYYADKIRFRLGMPESIGGWARLNATPYLGSCTVIFPWATLGGVRYTAVGTDTKFYAEYGSVLSDITPIRSTTAAGDVTFAAVDGSAVITATDTAHAAGVGDYVTFSGAASLGGNITAAVLNAEYEIISVPSAGTYTFTATATASAGDVGAGGAAVVGAYQIAVGLATYVPGIGWGSGSYSGTVWSGGAAGGTQLRLWDASMFGEDLIFCSRGGSLFYWDVTGGLSARAVFVTAMAGASAVPTVVTTMLVTSTRHVVAFGCNAVGGTDIDPLLVRWSDTESAVDWTPTATNTAGGERLYLGSSIITARATRLETLIFTDTALYGMTFLGGALEFGFNLLATPITIASPGAVGIVGGTAYWMGVGKFYVYNGAVATLPCPILNLILKNMNASQAYQVFAAVNEQFSEVSWHYCSGVNTTVDSYVTYNYADDIWYFGTLNRSAWVDAGLIGYPLGADNVNNVLVYHEFGADDNSTDTPAAVNSYIESSDFDLGDGHQFMFITRVLPDVSFAGSNVASPAVTLTLKTRNSAGQAWSSSSNQPSVNTVTRTASNGLFTSPVEETTAQLHVRLRGRQAALRIENNTIGVKWQLGAVRLDVRPDGRR